MTGELLGPVLVSLHNVFFYQKLMADCRRAIRQGAFNDFKEELTRRLEQWEQKEDFEAEDSPSGTLRPQS
jgi:queuine tRNA-ribosyltransferase